MAWTLRVRGPAGQSTLSGVQPDMSVADFLNLLHDKTSVPVGYQQVLVGFPPRPVQLADVAPDALLSTLPISNGDSLTVSQLAIPPPSPPPLAAAATESGVQLVADAVMMDADEDAQLAMAIAASLESSAAPNPAQTPIPIAPEPAGPPPPPGARAISLPSITPGAAVPSAARAVASPLPAPPPAPTTVGPAVTSIMLSDGSGSAVIRRVIDSDNSCLFNAVGYVMEGSRSRSRELRKLIADTVRSDPFEYNEGFLEMENEKYCSWITTPDKWGGAIELAILSRHYGREIAAYDIQTCRCDVYGQGSGYTERVMLLYDGLHYDAMAVSAFDGAPEELDVTIFEPGRGNADAIEQAAAKLVDSCNKARQFTDTASFTLRCGVCQIGLKGEKEAVAHAKSTGHQNFSEY